MPSPKGNGAISQSELSVCQLSTMRDMSAALIIPSALRSITGMIGAWYMSPQYPPNPPGRSELKYRVEPSGDIQLTMTE
jgi:hypothetical protein